MQDNHEHAGTGPGGPYRAVSPFIYGENCRIPFDLEPPAVSMARKPLGLSLPCRRVQQSHFKLKILLMERVQVLW